VENHGKALPPEVHNPRVAIRPEGAKIGWLWNSDELSAVFSLDVLLGLTEPNRIALTIRGARAGTVPLPLSQVLDTVTAAAHEMNLQLAWKKSGGHPVALITVPAPESKEQKTIVVETIELRDGALYLAGRTIPGEEWSATRDWSAFLDQMGEHSRQIEADADANAERSTPVAESARLPADENQSESSRKLQ
jgi:hypothetical protein